MHQAEHAYLVTAESLKFGKSGVPFSMLGVVFEVCSMWYLFSLFYGKTDCDTIP